MIFLYPEPDDFLSVSCTLKLHFKNIFSQAKYLLVLISYKYIKCYRNIRNSDANYLCNDRLIETTKITRFGLLFLFIYIIFLGGKACSSYFSRT